MAQAGEGETGRKLLDADAVGHGDEGAVLQRARRRQALRHRPAPAPGLALIGVGDPVGAVDDEIGAEIAQAAHVVREDEVVADRHPDPAERGLHHPHLVAGAAALALAREEVRLVVDREALPVGPEQELRIVDAAVTLRIGADGHGKPILPRDLAEALCARPVGRLRQVREPVAQEVTSGGAFGKDHEVRPLRRRGTGKAGDGREVPLRVARGAVHLHHGQGPGHAAHPIPPITPLLSSCPDLIRASMSTGCGGATWMAGSSPMGWTPPPGGIAMCQGCVCSPRPEGGGIHGRG